jgi:hypothetical protein
MTTAIAIPVHLTSLPQTSCLSFVTYRLVLIATAANLGAIAVYQGDFGRQEHKSNHESWCADHTSDTAAHVPLVGHFKDYLGPRWSAENNAPVSLDLRPHRILLRPDRRRSDRSIFQRHCAHVPHVAIDLH